MAFASTTEIDTGRTRGSFDEVEFGNHFEFSAPSEDEPTPFPEFPTKVWVGGMSGDEFRWAKVMKTRVFVVVDTAGDDGGPVVEKWTVRRMRNWNQ